MKTEKQYQDLWFACEQQPLRALDAAYKLGLKDRRIEMEDSLIDIFDTDPFSGLAGYVSSIKDSRNQQTNESPEQ